MAVRRVRENRGRGVTVLRFVTFIIMRSLSFLLSCSLSLFVHRFRALCSYISHYHVWRSISLSCDIDLISVSSSVLFSVYIYILYISQRYSLDLLILIVWD